METDTAAFNGWGIPQENWSKLPHCFIEALPLIETLAEMKVVLYVLRHTWGYQDDEKRISIDEFVNGRKHSSRYKNRHPEAGDRIDNGVGMSANAVKDGIKRAVKHGFIQVDSDDADKARIKRYYSLNLGGQKLTPRGSKVDPLPSEVDPRTKKETLERNSETTDAPVGAVSEKQDEQNDILDFHDGSVPEQKEPEPAQPLKMDAVEHIVRQAKKREDDPLWWLKPGTTCGDHEYLEPYKTFCAVIGRDPSTIGKHKTLSWLRQFEKMSVVSTGDDESEAVVVAPDVMARAIWAIRDEWGFEHKKWTRPFSDGFVALVEHTAAQIIMEADDTPISPLAKAGYDVDAIREAVERMAAADD